MDSCHFKSVLAHMKNDWILTVYQVFLSYYIKIDNTTVLDGTFKIFTRFNLTWNRYSEFVKTLMMERKSNKNILIFSQNPVQKTSFTVCSVIFIIFLYIYIQYVEFYFLCIECFTKYTVFACMLSKSVYWVKLENKCMRLLKIFLMILRKFE